MKAKGYRLMLRPNLCMRNGLQKLYKNSQILFPDEYNSILIKTEINVLVIPKMTPANQ